MDIQWNTLHRDFGAEGIVFVSLRGRWPVTEGNLAPFYRRLLDTLTAESEKLARRRQIDYARNPDPKKRFRHSPILIRVLVTQEENAVVRRIRICHEASVICDKTFRDEFLLHRGKLFLKK